MPEYCDLIKQIVDNVLVDILGTMLDAIGGMLTSMLVFSVLIIIINILTDNKLIITMIIIIINSLKISCILIREIVKCIRILYVTGIIKNEKNTITNQV